MTVEMYDSKIREVAHFTNAWGESFIIINQSYWYDANKYTEEQAIEDWMRSK